MVQSSPHPGVANRRTRERKREILRAAAELFRRQGLQATGMRDIAAAAGMAVGNLYYYFEDKQELLAFCQEDALEGLLALAARVRALPSAPERKLRLMIVGHLGLLHEETPGSLAHLEVSPLAPDARQAVLARRDAYESAWRELLRHGQETGAFRPVDTRVAAATILGALNWTAQWYRPDGGKDPAQLGEEMAELLLRGVLAEGVPVPRGGDLANELSTENGPSAAGRSPRAASGSGA
jgi:TetR/AcrR family transcriptional regulator, cholesterol catabolism regulator